MVAVRKQRATTKSMILEKEITGAVRRGKLKYRDEPGEFYIFEAYEGAGYYYAESSKLSNNYIQFWKFNFDNNRWECLSEIK
jgi:hypothetical protein